MVTKTKAAPKSSDAVSVAALQAAIAETNKSNYFVYVVSTAAASYVVPQKSTAMAVAKIAAKTLHESDEKVVFVKHGMQASDEQTSENVIVQQQQSVVAAGKLDAVNSK